MIVSLIQMDIKWADPVANQKAAESALLYAERSDLYVLPEMWSTGFATEPSKVADANKTSLTWMQQMAREKNSAICGSVATKCEDDTYRNRMYFVTPDSVTFYDKHHLFGYGYENECYTAGNERVVVEWRGVRFLLQVCYDLRFPCFSRNKSPQPPKGELLKYDSQIVSSTDKTIYTDSPFGGWVAVPYDCAIYVASWPTSRIRVWNTLLQARALENQCYVLGVNRIGEDPACKYCGGTQCVDAYGRVVAACEDNTAQTITVNLDMEKLLSFRKKFPVLADADNITVTP